MVNRRLPLLTIVAVALCVSLVGQASAFDPGDFFIPGPIIPIPPILLATEITTVQQLKDVQKNLAGRYVLKADLDLGNKSWEPIGRSTSGGFTGQFDGNGHTISGLRADTGSALGLFSVLGDGAIVRNISVKGETVASVGGAGLLAGFISVGATVEDCGVDGTVKWEGPIGGDIGGVAGVNEGMVKNCTAAVTVEGAAQTGGIVGTNRGSITSATAGGNVTTNYLAGGIVALNYGSVTNSQSSVRVFSQKGLAGGVAADNRHVVEKSLATGAVFGAANTGGLVGSNVGQIIASSASGAVSGTIRVGGLVGTSEGGTIARSFATGTVSGDEAVGGLVGQTDINVGLRGGEPVPVIEDSYALSHVTGQNNVGGLIGRNQGAIVRQAYAAGRVIGTTNTAGLVGAGTDHLTLTALRWDMEATGQSAGIGGTAAGVTGIMGLTTQKMRDPASYGGWDFDTVWGIEAGKTYPQLDQPGIRGQVGVSFTDTKGHWAEAEILQLANSGVVSGIGGGLFNPDGSVSRAEFAKMIVLGLGLEPHPLPQLTFADTAHIPDWATGYVAVAVSEGIIKGLDGNRFGPAELITREQIAAMVVRALKLTPVGSLSAADVAVVSDWAQSEVQAALEHGILLRRDGSGAGAVTGALLPVAYGTRAEAARAVARLQALRAGH